MVLRAMSNFSKPLFISVTFALLWSVAATVSPTTTFHLGPLIVAASPIMLGDRSTRTGATSIAPAVAVATSILLAATDLLRGPSVLPWGGPLAESLVFAAVGGVILVAARFVAPQSVTT